MKKILLLLITLVALFLIIVLLTSCSSTNTVLKHNTTEQQLNVKIIPIRMVSGDKVQQICTTGRVIYNITPSSFTLQLPNKLLHLKGLYKYSADREYFEGYDKDMHKYSLYYYAYKHRVYIQITPIHNGQVPFINKSEVIYIVTTDSICT